MLKWFLVVAVRIGRLVRSRHQRQEAPLVWLGIRIEEGAGGGGHGREGVAAEAAERGWRLAIVTSGGLARRFRVPVHRTSASHYPAPSARPRQLAAPLALSVHFH